MSEQNETPFVFITPTVIYNKLLDVEKKVDRVETKVDATNADARLTALEKFKNAVLGVLVVAPPVLTVIMYLATRGK